MNRCCLGGSRLDSGWLSASSIDSERGLLGGYLGLFGIFGSGLADSFLDALTRLALLLLGCDGTGRLGCNGCLAGFLSVKESGLTEFIKGRLVSGRGQHGGAVGFEFV